MVCPRKIVADSETQQFEITVGGGCQTVLSERDLSGFKGTFQVFDHLVMCSRCEEREESAACLSEG